MDIRRDTHTERMRIKLALADTIILDPALSSLERRVALRMLSAYLHFRTLRMWPGAERLAAELAANERNIRRALSRLCRAPKDDDPGGYFTKVPGTGRGPRNPTVYEARWERAFEGAKAAKERREEAAKAGQNARLKAGQNAPLSLKEETFDFLIEGVGGVGEEGELPATATANGSTSAMARQGRKRWRASAPRPPGPGEQALHGGDHDRDETAKPAGGTASPPGSDLEEDGRRVGSYGGRARAAG